MAAEAYGLDYRRRGAGPVLVLQHGFLGGAGAWLPQLAFFSRGFDVIAPELPGFAGSGRLPPADSIEAMAEAVVGLLDSLGVERFFLLGHSMGGMVVQAIAARHGRRIGKLVLYGTAASGEMPQRFESFAASAERFRRDGLEATTARITATWFLEGAEAACYQLCLEAGRGASLEAALAGLRAMPAWRLGDGLAALTMPTLVVGGDQDRSYGLYEMVALARAIPGARLAILPGCAHNAHLEKPELFNGIVQDFLLAT